MKDAAKSPWQEGDEIRMGFVNALAILIFRSQVSELIGGLWLVYPLMSRAVSSKLR